MSYPTIPASPDKKALDTLLSTTAVSLDETALKKIFHQPDPDAKISPAAVTLSDGHGKGVSFESHVAATNPAQGKHMQAQIQDVLQQSPKPPAFLSQPWAQDGNRAVKDSGFRVEVPLFSIGNKQNGVERIVGDSAFNAEHTNKVWDAAADAFRAKQQQAINREKNGRER